MSVAFSNPEGYCREDGLDLEIKKLQKINSHGGDIFVFEGHRFDFPIRRVYFTKNVPVGEVRGYHAHKTLEQILLCPHGTIEVTLDRGKGKKETITLANPENAIYVGPATWRTMKWLELDSILLVFASQQYEESDYIRDYEAFKEFVSKD